MKANHLPKAEELGGDKPLEDKEQALIKAIRATHLLTGKFLEVVDKDEAVMLSSTPYVLRWPANSAPTAYSKDGQTATLDYDYYHNTIYPDLDTEEYIVSYQTGYSPTNVPAVVKELIRLLGNWFLLKEDDLRGEILAVAEAVKRVR